MQEASKNQKSKVRYKWYQITICGDKWKYRPLPTETYNKLHGADSVAITYSSKKSMEFDAGHVTFGCIFHELFHAYCKYLYLNSADIDKHNLEEIYAEMLEEKVEKIIQQAYQLLRRMKGE